MNNQIKKEKFKVKFTNISNTKQLKNKFIVNNNYIIKKRTPFQLSKKNNNVYVNTRTDFKLYLKLCEIHLESHAKEVVIHGLGAAINRVCKLALCIQDIYHGTLQLETKMSSINLSDDFEPNNDDFNYEVNERINSSIHIRLFHIVLLGSPRFKS